MYHDNFRLFEKSSQMKLIRAKGNTTFRTFFDQVLRRIKLRQYASAADKEHGGMLHILRHILAIVNHQESISNQNYLKAASSDETAEVR